MILRPLFCFKDTKNTGLLMFNSLKQKEIIFVVNRNWKKLTDSCKRAKILADNRKSYHPIETLVKLFLLTCKVRGFNSFASNMIKLSVNETEWSSHNPRSYPLYSGPKRYSLNFIRLRRVVITTRTAGKYVIAASSEVRGREVRKMLG